MLAKRLLLAVLCGALAAPAAAQRVTETSLPLADPGVWHFSFIRDIGLAIDYNGSGKVDARINAYNLASPALLWHQQVRVQDDGNNLDKWLTVDADRNRLYLGNGPLSAVDAATGRILWSLDCRTLGSVDFADASFFGDGTFLVQGGSGCGDPDQRRVTRVDDSTGGVRWQVDVESHTYKTGKVDHRDFAMYYEGDTHVDDLIARADAGDSAAADSAAVILLRKGGATPTHVLLAGKRFTAIDYATGRQVWAVKDEPGRWVPLTPTGLSLWVDDDKLVAYSTHDGARQWAVPLNAPWAVVYEADTTATSDLIAVTWKGAHRIDRSGHVTWSLARDDNTWGQTFMPPLLMLALKDRTWAAVDLATGRARWSVKIESAGNLRRADDELSVGAIGVVLIAGYDNSRIGPFSLNGIDAASGRLLWTLDRVNDAKLIHYYIVDGTRLDVFTENFERVELDVRTGAVIGTGMTAGGGARVSYSAKTKTLTARGPNGQVVWTRKGQESEYARVSVLAQGVVVWPTQDGTVELIDLPSGTSLHTTTGNPKPRIGVDRLRGRVLVPQGKTIRILTVTAAP
jgi:outer membrane protein assembly factor BamB